MRKQKTLSQLLPEGREEVSNPSVNPIFATILEQRLGRREVLKGSGVIGLTLSLPTAMGVFPKLAKAAERSSLTFKEIPHGLDQTHHVPDGYSAKILIRWGDPVLAGAPEFDPMTQTADRQAQQFGYNNDMLAYFPLPAGSRTADHGLLCVNHEHTRAHMMFPGYPDNAAALGGLTKEQAEIEMAAHGVSILEIKRQDRDWQVVANSRYARRVTALNTEMAVSGPAAGNDRMKTSADASGKRIIGTLNNCAGGWTPWGTYLAAEENFHIYFSGAIENEAYKRYGIGGRPAYAWGRYFDRFNLEKEPNEPNRFGWIVEIDPYDPQSVPVKHTALGRAKHENASTVLAPNGQVVVYSGDDEHFEYIYKFVSKKTFNPDDREANKQLLTEGTLYVAEFQADGKVIWHPLIYGMGKLTAENGFHSQADVLIDARQAADLVGATKMDRPEDVDVNPVNGHAYVVLTKNNRRKDNHIEPANPRANNLFGHILELIPEDGDHSRTRANWEIFILAGDPSNTEHKAHYGAEISDSGWFYNPDNVTFDRKGRIWISTDGAVDFGLADGLWASDVEGEGRAVSRHFFACPSGSELCGPLFSPDNKTLFLSVQHPATDGEAMKGSHFDKPAHRWPDFRDGVPPRPSVVVITKDDDGEIGG